VNQGGQLKQDMSVFAVVALGVSAAVGVSIFSVTAPATAVAGPAMLISLGIAAIPMIVFVVVYAFLGSAVPRSGASYDWPARFVHPYLGFIVTWLRIVGNAVSLQVMTVVFVGYLFKAISLTWAPTAFLILCTFYIVNLIGVGTAGKVASVLVLLKLLVLGTFILAGVPHIQSGNVTPLMPHGPWSILAALPLLIGLYTGIESAAEAGEEIRNAKAVIGRALAIATLIGMVAYFGTSAVTLGVLGSSKVASSTAPLLEAGTHFLGPWTSPLLVLTALASISAAINATFLIFARFLFAMGRDGVLPAALARIHPRWGTPHVATTVAFGLGVLALFLPESLAFLFLAANIPTMLKYFSNCLAAWRLVDRHQDLHARANIKMSRRSVKVWSSVGMLCAIIIVLAGLGTDWRPYAILAAWGCLGTLYWWVYARHLSLSMRQRGIR
jgi:APA family basic amino acid/polyamine antiporter